LLLSKKFVSVMKNQYFIKNFNNYLGKYDIDYDFFDLIK
jgi:hypothetical protein